MLYFACRVHFVYLCILKISHKYHALWEMPWSFVHDIYFYVIEFQYRRKYIFDSSYWFDKKH